MTRTYTARGKGGPDAFGVVTKAPTKTERRADTSKPSIGWGSLGSARVLPDISRGGNL